MSKTLKTTELWKWHEFLCTPHCTCPTEWRSLGVLYGVNFGKGWVRMDTDPACPDHGDAAPPLAPIPAGAS